ncbi:hypothetical protein [Nocardia macrotermitis]|uniref:Uncharacterized protein n=1 Tax=Nocardia macrotermitis TaxID=2585198 RepID=A0A7K0DBL3_9NOCA|nr:hypothetical protein [Nocardia macrotermitis]MQY22901.1 hypothetical protein [Nocardia macrotermitis]
MAVQVTRSLISSDRTKHKAVPVGQGCWAASYLPGQALDAKQATEAIRIADTIAEMRERTQLLGLTPMEAIGLATYGYELPKRHWDTFAGRIAVVSAGVVTVLAAQMIWIGGYSNVVREVAALPVSVLSAAAVLILCLSFLFVSSRPRRSAETDDYPPVPIAPTTAWSCSTRPARLSVPEAQRILEVHRGHNCARRYCALISLQRRLR